MNLYCMKCRQAVDHIAQHCSWKCSYCGNLRMSSSWKKKRGLQSISLQISKLIAMLKYRHPLYHGKYIIWLIENKRGKNIGCHFCGNIANGVMIIQRLSVPLCKGHIQSICERYDIDTPQTVPCAFAFPVESGSILDNCRDLMSITEGGLDI